jgi:predicted Zn-dependent protease
MIGATRLLSDLTKLVKQTRADEVSATAQARTRRVFRFAYEAVHQDLHQESLTVMVKVTLGRRIGVATTETLEPAALRRCAEAARTIAEHAREQALIAPAPWKHRLRVREDYLKATAQYTAADMAGHILRLMQYCQGLGVALAGSAMTGEDELAVVNSQQVTCYCASTVAGTKLVTMHGAASGYASAVSRDATYLDWDGALRRALEQALQPGEPAALPVGTYEVILEPEAVADLLLWLSYTAFGAKNLQEGSSCLAGRLGQRIFSPDITLADDGQDPGVLRMPFDFEGTPKQRVALIDRGIAQGVVYDTLYGARMKHASTGHGLPATETEGPFPLHLVMSPGALPLAELIRGCARGLLIPRFHYVNGLLNPREALMTGLTREGTRLIEEGKLTAPVKTLRFTQSLLEAFSSVRRLSRERRLIADPAQELGCALVPAMHLDTFRFTGQSP